MLSVRGASACPETLWDGQRCCPASSASPGDERCGGRNKSPSVHQRCRLTFPVAATCGDLINVEGQGYRCNVRARNLKVLVVDGGKNDLEVPRDGCSRSRGIGEGRAAQKRGVWQKRVEQPRFCENGTPVSDGVYRLRTTPKYQSQTSSSPSFISH